MEHINDKWWTFDRILLFSICVIAAISISIVGWQARVASDKAERTALTVAAEVKNREAIQKADRVERVRLLNEANKEHCDEIEAMKTEFRREAIEDYKNLDRTLALLNLERTPAIEERARTDMEQTVAKFQRGACPRRILMP